LTFCQHSFQTFGSTGARSLLASLSNFQLLIEGSVRQCYFPRVHSLINMRWSIDLYTSCNYTECSVKCAKLHNAIIWVTASKTTSLYACLSNIKTLQAF